MECKLYIFILFLGLASFVSCKKNHTNPDAEVLKTYLNESPSDDMSQLMLQYISVVDLKFQDSIRNISKLPIKYVKNFYLWTNDYREGREYEDLNPKNISSIKYSHFKTRKTVCIIHGFLGNGLEEWILNLKNKFLYSGDYNVISVDWPAGTSWFMPSYVSASNRVPYVGNDTAVLLSSLIQYKGLQLEDVHFLGHSLGAHVSGFASKIFKGRVGQITGLDPAGPYYHKLEASKRLDKTDAVYVDIIHTNACYKWPYFTDCYGLNENIGHSDFWPNGGEHQPACALLKKVIGGDIGCDHMIAHVYYAESFNYGTNDTYFMARPCRNWTQFLQNNCSCGSPPQFMGINVNTLVVGTFFLETEIIPPYAEKDWECEVTFVVPWNMIILIAGGLLLISFLVICFIFGGYCVNIIRHSFHGNSEETQHLLSSDAAMVSSRKTYYT